MDKKIIRGFSEETKKKMAEIALKQIEKGIRKGLYIKRHKKGMTGKHHTEEVKRKISESNKIICGKIKGKTWEERFGKDRAKLYKQRLMNKLSGEKNPFFGKKHSEITRRKISEIQKGKHTNPSGEFTKEKRRNMILPVKDTKIEVKLQNFLKQLGMTFFTHQYMKEIEHSYQCDILIPSMNLVIECDGDYWHKYPIGKDIDHIRTKELLEKGFRVLRLWEHEIDMMTIKDLKSKLFVQRNISK